MRKFLIFFCILCIFLIPCYALDNPLSEGVPILSPEDISTAVYDAIIESRVNVIDEFTPISDVSIMPLYTGDTGTTVIPSGSFRAVLQLVLGPYSPVVVQYQYTNGTNTQYLREILPDYQWMISAAIFAMIIWCVFRLWGAILCKR